MLLHLRTLILGRHRRTSGFTFPGYGRPRTDQSHPITGYRACAVAHWFFSMRRGAAVWRHKISSITEARREQAFPDSGCWRSSACAASARSDRTSLETSPLKPARSARVSLVILSGKVAVARHASSGQGPLIVRHVAGSFLGELAQLAGRPALVDAHAEGPVEALVIPPDLAARVMIAEAELGERIMARAHHSTDWFARGRFWRASDHRSLESGDVLSFGRLRRNGHPHQKLDPENDSEARALIERFILILASCRSFCVLPDSCCATPAKPSWRVASGSLDLSIRTGSSTSWSWALARLGLPRCRLCWVGRSPVLVLDCRAFGGQAGASARIENYLGFPTGIRPYGARLQSGAEIRCRDGDPR